MAEKIKLERAPQPTPFLEGEYFRGLCEIAAACETSTPLFVPDVTKGLFDSLFYKRIYARYEMKDGSYSVGEFDLKNRYLYNYDRDIEQYTSVKQKNYDTFIATVKDIITNNDYQIFSLTPVTPQTLNEALA